MRGIIETENLCKEYRVGKQTIHALNKVNLLVEKGSFTTIIGKSGAGKTTLIKLLSTYEEATSGKIYIAGHDITTLKKDQVLEIRQKEMGFISQEHIVFPDFTVGENLTIPVHIARRKVDKIYLSELMKQLGILDKENVKVGELSAGELRRVMIARSLAMRPNIVFADEPTESLDCLAAEDVINLLKVLSGKFRQTVLMVTHDIRIAQQGDTILELRDGELTAVMEGASDHYF